MKTRRARSRPTMHRFWRSWGSRRGCGAIWFGTSNDTLAEVAGLVRRTGCEKTPSWAYASFSQDRRECVIALFDFFGVGIRRSILNRPLPNIIVATCDSAFDRSLLDAGGES